ncbi:MAG: tetratricopeptide repeat protein [Lysobacterales bacterium]
MSAANANPSYPLLRALARIRAAFGHTPSMVLLGAIYESGAVTGKSMDHANELYLKAAQLGDHQAMWHLGVNHLASKGGNTDHTKAVHWLHQAAEAGHAMAAWALGKMYLSGKLVDQDCQRGLALLEQSASSHCSQARQTLADIYREGRHGVVADPERAAFWSGGQSSAP